MPQPPSRAFPHSALQASLETRQARADARATNLAPLIAQLQAAGVTSQRAIAKVLNARGVPTPTGDGRWRASQVSRLLRRLPV
jgi:hypothetical protein